MLTFQSIGMKSKNKIEKKKINSYQSKEKPQPTGLNLSEAQVHDWLNSISDYNEHGLPQASHLIMIITLSLKLLSVTLVGSALMSW